MTRPAKGSADLEREVAELRRQLDGARAQQQATAEVLQVINSSPGDLAPVFDAMIEKAVRLCSADQGVLRTFDGQAFPLAAINGHDPDIVERVKQLGPIRVYGLMDPLVRGEHVVHIADVQETETYRDHAIARERHDLAGIRTLLMVALHKEGALLGAIIVYRREVRPFSDREIGLLENFAAQAVIAIENARLITETREALEQQTATAEVLQVINSSPGDLAPVFEAMLEKAMHLCEASFGVLSRIDGENFSAIAVRGAPPALAEAMRQPRAIIAGNAHYRLIHGEEFVEVDDVTAENVYRSGNPARRALADLGGARTALWVALRKDGAALGALMVYRQEVRPFTGKQIALLQNFAAQAVIAMENARLLTETREALDQQTATAEVLGVINASPGDLGPVFDAMLEKALRLCEAAVGVMLTWDGERFSRVAWRGVPEALFEALPVAVKPPPGAPGYRLAEGENVIRIADLAEDSASNHGPSMQNLARIGARSYVNVALRKDNHLLGSILIYRRKVQPFTDKEVALLQNFAAQAVIAMENARLITETREALDQQTATAEVLQVINSSPGDLAPVFDAMLEKAMRLCDAAFGVLWGVEGDRVRPVASHAVPAAYQDFLRCEHSSPGPQSAVARTIRQRSSIHFIDAAAGEPYRSGDPFAVAAVELGGVRTLVNVPLIKDDSVLGIFGIYRQEVRPFSDKQIALLQNFAAQAVIAMENARLLTETREALDQQTATAEVLQVINSSPGDLAPVFEAMLEKAMRLCAASFGDLLTYDGERFRPVATRGFPPALIDFFRDPFTPGRESYLGRLVRGEVVLPVADMAAQYSSGSVAPLSLAGGERGRALVELGNARTGLFLALRKDDALLGAIRIYRQEVRAFTDKQIALLQNFAAQAVIAMENARLITETREALDQQTATAEVLGVINSSPGDLAPVFDAMLDKAMRLCGAAFGGFSAYDGELLRTTASRGMPPALAEFFREPFRVGRGVATRRIADGEPVVQIADITTHESYPSAGLRALAELGGGRTVIWVALRKEETLLGIITMYRQEVRPFTDKQIALLQNFAAQAVIAMENARLLGELRQRTDEVAALNRDLEARVAEQVDELGRVGRLKRFLAPQLAELIVSQGDEKILESHRREIVVVFCDLRGYTAFTETAEPEEVLDFLREYHGALGPLVAQFEGTLDQFSGDGIMVFFNDPVPCPDPAERAVKMAVAMRGTAGTLIAAWRRRGRELGFGAGIAQGYATLGQIGFAERSGYTAIGTVCNLAARLCGEAKDGQILVSQRVAAAVEESIAVEEIGALALKGLAQPVVAFNVVEAGTAANRIRLV